MMQYLRKLFRKHDKTHPVGEVWNLDVLTYPHDEEEMSLTNTINLGQIQVKNTDTLGTLVDKVRNDILGHPELTEEDFTIHIYFGRILGFSSGLQEDYMRNRILCKDTSINHNSKLYVVMYKETKNSRQQFMIDIRKQYKKYKISQDSNTLMKVRRNVEIPFNENTIKMCLDKRWYAEVEELHQMGCPWTEVDKRRYIEEVVLNNW